MSNVNQFFQKLTKREKIIFLATVLFAIAALILWRSSSQGSKNYAELSKDYQRDLVNVTRAREDADLKALESERQKLLEAMGTISRPLVNAGALSLKLWTIASNANTSILAFEYKPEARKADQIEIITNKFTVVVKGNSSSLNKFLELTSKSLPSPYFEQLSITRETDQKTQESSYRMNLVIDLFSIQ